jgi:L-glutamine-phosphate cytidylyltransferase
LSRSITTIKTLPKDTKGISVVILSAGAGLRIRSNEPRSLIKINNETLINHQIKAIEKSLSNHEIVGVFGTHIDRIIKKLNGKIRVVENQLHESTNNSESMRLGLNNCTNNSIVFIHGDIYFEPDLLREANYNKSFLVLDANGDIGEKEVGVTVSKKNVSILSYGLKKKWCQICHVTGKELKILKGIFSKFKQSDKKMLSFELINKIIENGGSFTFYEKKDSHVVEIDCIKDLNNENFNL